MLSAVVAASDMEAAGASVTAVSVVVVVSVDAGLLHPIRESSYILVKQETTREVCEQSVNTFVDILYRPEKSK